MRGNQLGKLFSMTSFGESHGECMGVVIDGVPSNLKVNLKDLYSELLRRAPGQHKVHTNRKEDDAPVILSGVFEGKTLGTPIAVIVKNTNKKSEDYKKEDYRAGHADLTTMMKFGIRDYRGGGRASGRETVSRVIAGYFASLVLPKLSTYAYITHLGPFSLKSFPKSHTVDRGPLNIPDKNLSKKIENFLLKSKKEGESWGGIVRLSIQNVPPGLGEPAFDKLKADLTKALMSIGATLGVSLNNGFAHALLPGSTLSKDKKYFSGMEGGISNGEEIILDIAFKAPSTIGKKAIEGRHDPCILPRVVPVVEAMAKIVIVDHYLRQKAYLT